MENYVECSCTTNKVSWWQESSFSINSVLWCESLTNRKEVFDIYSVNIAKEIFDLQELCAFNSWNKFAGWDIAYDLLHGKLLCTFGVL